MLFICAGKTSMQQGYQGSIMSRKLVPGLSDLVYSIICDNPGVFKYDLHKMVHERLNNRVTESDFSDVISFLKLHRGGPIKLSSIFMTP